MNFIMKFLKKRFVTKSDYMEGILSHDSNIRRYLSEAAANQATIFDLSVRIADLEKKISSQPKIVLYNSDKSSRNWDGSPKSNTDAIIGVLKDSEGKKLHYSDIYSKMKGYNLINPNVTTQSVKAILYQLARQKRIVLDNGTETGLFFIEKE